MLVPPHYRTLGVLPDASPQEILAAYRMLAKKFHPDMNRADPRSEELFKKISAAYEVLSDPKSRLDYDLNNRINTVRHGGNTRAGKQADSSGWEETPESGAETVDAEISADKKKTDADDGTIRIRLFLQLKEAFKGGTKTLRYPRRSVCVVCSGAGRASSNGSTCGTCSGKGLVNLEQKVKVAYPKGVRHGEKLRVIGAGHFIKAHNRPGDLEVSVLLKTHEYLAVQGGNLQYRCVIGLDLYIEGGSILVPMANGKKKEVEIPPRYPDGKVLRLASLGFPARDKLKAGDMLVTIEHCLPRKLSSKERARIEEIMRLPGFKPPTDRKGLTPRVEEE